MPDYNKGKIYKIVNIASNDEHDCYVGSTCNNITDRFSGHKSQWKRKDYDGMRIYEEFDKHGVDNFRIVLVEEYPCENKNQLIAREEHHRLIIKPNYNVRKVIYEGDKEYYQKHKERIKARVREYAANNRDKVLANKREYRVKNLEKIKERNSKPYECECGGNYTYNDRQRHFKTIKHTQYLESKNNQAVN